MIRIKKNEPASASSIEIFLLNIAFELPKGFVEFFSESNGGVISGENNYVEIWPLTEMIQLNKSYEVDKYASDYFVFGSDGGGAAYCIEKKTAFIYEMQFIGMPDGVSFICKSFEDFLKKPFSL